MHTAGSFDPHAQLRALYLSLLHHQEHFDEFRQLLAMYGASPEHSDEEPEDAAQVRAQLNERIRDWVGTFSGLSAVQMLHWRAILVEERFNVALSPWKDSNMY
ncbi:hypothetical protein [Chondromyces crocatus]|uniref:Uncharacterized protein n=1 Tax=Chondromyces crocatus TaxID=52 RepID=A0A0K1EFD9_CHOCO|nr:hypothetical protein [Chondromyces crocatus]AKT39576.1 uncharacterized protein CMC5_037250 [Chondromyces crocatus]